MPPTLSPHDFAAKWRITRTKERSSSQEHFIDLCRMVGVLTPNEGDPTGESYVFEKGANKQLGGQGWADVWKRGCFAWEYKGRHADLDKAYRQLQQYRESLQNPPLLITSDLERIIIHTNITNSVKQVFEITLDDMASSRRPRPTSSSACCSACSPYKRVSQLQPSACSRCQACAHRRHPAKLDG